MARSEARLRRGVWKGLRGLPPHAKLLYAVLLTEPTMNHAGVCALRLDLWADNAELSEGETDKAFAELLDKRHGDPYVLADSSTREVLVRTIIRNDGVADQPYLLKGALKEALQTESRTLRRVLAAELRKLPPQRPDGVSKTGAKIVYPDPHAAADLLDPPSPPDNPGKGFDTHSNGSPEPLSDDASETLSEDSRQALDTHSAVPVETLSGGSRQAPDSYTSAKGSRNPPERERGRGRGRGSTSVPVPENSSFAAQRRGRRIPDDFEATAEMVEWARTNTPLVGRGETEQFRDYWQAASGATATKRDWRKAWQVWMRREQQQAERRGGRLRAVPPARPDDPVLAFADLRQRGDALAASRLITANWIEPSQPPSDPTPPREWLHARRVEFIDVHADELRAALAKRRAG